MHEEKWHVRLDFHIEQITAGSGVVDVLRFAIPDHWDDLDGSLEASPPAAISLERQPGETGQQLVVRPAQAIDGPFHLTVRGLTLAKGQRVELPDIVPLGLGNPRRFVALPGPISGQQFQWERQDLRKLSIGDLPSHFRAALRPRSTPAGDTFTSDTFTSYEVNGARPQAVRRSVRQIFDDPLVRLMDVTVAWQTDGSCRGTVVYDLEPAGMTDVRLKMPSGYRLVAARVAGFEAGARREDEGEGESLWRIPLASAQLPQRIEVTFTGQMTLDNIYQPDFAAPWLLQVGVERTLWTICSPPSVGVGRSPRATDQTTALAQARSRLRHLANLIEEEAPVAAISSPEHLAAWYRPWAKRLIAARRELRRQQLTAADGQAADDGARDGDRNGDEDFDRRQAQISPQIQSILNELARQTPTTGDPAGLRHLDLDESQITTRYAFVGEIRELSLRYTPPPQGDLGGRGAMALLMLTFSAAAVWVVRRGFAIPSPTRWAHAMAVALGLAWWLWLSPSLVGGLIVLFAVASAVWPWRLRASPRPWTLRPAPRSL